MGHRCSAVSQSLGARARYLASLCSGAQIQPDNRSYGALIRLPDKAFCGERTPPAPQAFCGVPACFGAQPRWARIQPVREIFSDLVFAKYMKEFCMFLERLKLLPLG